MEPQYDRARGIFFFQAEDGIRDWSVTGVQTCALPISPSLVRGHRDRLLRQRQTAEPGLGAVPGPLAVVGHGGRSEERRVGKECRWRWWPHDKNKKATRRHGMAKEGSRRGTLYRARTAT